MKIFKNLFTVVIVLMISFPVLVCISSYDKYRTAVDAVPIEEKVAQIRNGDNYWGIDDIPKFYIDAVVSVEDRRFYSHNGFDFIGTLRAIITDIKTKSLREGGSTISQQLAKNMYFPLDNTIERKIAEIFTAVDIEKRYTKNEVLELYFNCIYFGSGYYNIYDAAVGYFGKEPCEMNEYEASLLAGVPNAPSVYSPKVNPDLAHNRQEKVLDTMVDCGKITEEKKQEILLMQKEYQW